MDTPARRSLLLLLLLAACAGSPIAIGTMTVPREVAVVVGLAEGTVVRLVGSEGATSVRTTGEVADGLLREAMRQSSYFDVASGPVAARPTHTPAVQVRFDAASGMAVARLVQTGSSVHLVTMALGQRSFPSAIDELAVRIRLALGDPVTEEPLPLQRIYSDDLEVVAGCEAALSQAGDGNFEAAWDRLTGVRRNDGGSSFLLECLASIAVVQGRATEARSLAQEALALERRTSPTTTHRLLRTLLLARASLEPQLATRYDQEVWTLAVVGGRERPHDPEVRITAGVARNFLGQFEDAYRDLAPLAERLPRHASVHYHLGWAALGSGRGKEAAEAFAIAAHGLPARAIVVPRALALWTAGNHDELRRLLADVASDPAVRAGNALHEVLRMRAAHELLCDNTSTAVDLIFEDLDWLLAHPSILDQRAGELADVAETVVRLGHGQRLRPYLSSVLDREANTLLADASTYGLGLAEAASKRTRVTASEDNLRRRGAGFWADSLRAFGSSQLGELAAEQQALGAAATQSTSPLITAALVANLRSQGREEEAAKLRTAMRRELTEMHMRHKLVHPLLGPELAFAWLSK